MFQALELAEPRKRFMPGGRPLSAPRKEKGHSNSVLFWSGLREQKQTTECCRLRSECVETRGNSSQRCKTKMCAFRRNIAKRGEDTRNQYKKSNWCKLNHERQTMFQALELAEPRKRFMAGPTPLYTKKLRGSILLANCARRSVAALHSN